MLLLQPLKITVQLCVWWEFPYALYYFFVFWLWVKYKGIGHLQLYYKRMCSCINLWITVHGCTGSIDYTLYTLDDFGDPLTLPLRATIYLYTRDSYKVQWKNTTAITAFNNISNKHNDLTAWVSLHTLVWEQSCSQCDARSSKVLRVLVKHVK